MPIFGKSKIGDSCFIDPDALIGYPHKSELDKNRDDIELLIKEIKEMKGGVKYLIPKFYN